MIWYNKNYAPDLSIIEPIEQAIYVIELETNGNVT